MGGKTTPIRFYAVRNRDTGEFLEYGGRGAIWANYMTIRSLRDDANVSRDELAGLEGDDARHAEIIEIDPVVSRSV